MSRARSNTKNNIPTSKKGGMYLIESFVDYCTFHEKVTKLELLNLLTDRRFEKLLKHKENLQCHNHPRICLKLSWNQFTRPTHRLNDVRSIGRVTDVDNNVVTIQLDEDSPETPPLQIPVQHIEVKRLMQLLSYIRGSFAYKLEILSDYKQTLLKSVVGINFIQLSIIHISYSNMASIQPLLKLYAPNLRQFKFEYNKITDLRVLKKLEVKGFKVIGSINYQPQGCPFGQMYNLSTHFPTISHELVKNKCQSAYYKARPIWRDHFLRLQRFFLALTKERRALRSF